jgi:hypothetical protein
MRTNTHVANAHSISLGARAVKRLAIILEDIGFRESPVVGWAVRDADQLPDDIRVFWAA